MSNLQKRKEGGFTIIEVLIVLAIAGLIMLIVFLAVPALQRNSRNTQRKNDVAAALAAASEYANNNGCTSPAAINFSAGTATFCDATPCGTTGISPATAKFGYYNASTLTTAISTFSSMPASASDKLVLYSGAVCSGNAAIAGSARSVVAIYGIEGSGNSYTFGCQGS